MYFNGGNGTYLFDDCPINLDWLLAKVNILNTNGYYVFGPATLAP